jgi:Flp pilus assembly protein TadG
VTAARMLLARLRRDERGQVTGFAVVMVTAMIAVAGLVLDGGLAVAAKVKAVEVAQAAARAGAAELDLAAYRRTGAVRLDVPAARDAAQAWLEQAGATGTVTATVTQVRVEVTAVATTQLLALVGVGSITVHGAATATAVRSDTG